METDTVVFPATCHALIGEDQNHIDKLALQRYIVVNIRDYFFYNIFRTLQKGGADHAYN